MIKFFPAKIRSDGLVYLGENVGEETRKNSTTPSNVKCSTVSFGLLSGSRITAHCQFERQKLMPPVIFSNSSLTSKTCVNVPNQRNAKLNNYNDH